MAQRLIKIEYKGAGTYRTSAAGSIQGALRAALIRVYDEEYSEAWIHDLRFGGVLDDHNSVSIIITRTDCQVRVRWTSEKPE